MRPPLDFALPYRRWFVWLLVGCLLALALPYFNNGDGWLYSPAIHTAAQDASGDLVATPEHIWIDARTAAFLNASDWLYIGLIPVSFESLWLLVRRGLASRASRCSPVTRPT